MGIPSYRKVKNLGHKDTSDVFNGPVIVQEKLDGSQISFGLVDGELYIRSKGTHRDLDGDAGIFQTAVDEIKKRHDLLEPGVIYRGEYLRTPKHNHLCYDRVPQGHIALWEYELQEYPPIVNPCETAEHLGFDVAPVLYEGEIDSEEQIEELLDAESFLGGEIEGVVIKNPFNGVYAKVVRPEFREKQKQRKPKKTDPIAEIANIYCTEARWRKAVQHLRDAGELTGTPKDIGPIIKEIQQDIMDECGDEIKEAVFRKHRKQLFNGFIKGFPEWYKDQVSVNVFGE